MSPLQSFKQSIEGFLHVVVIKIDMYSRLKTVIFLVFIISSFAKCRKGTNKPLVLMRYSNQQLSIKVKLTTAHPPFSLIGFTSKSWMFQTLPKMVSYDQQTFLFGVDLARIYALYCRNTTGFTINHQSTIIFML